MSWSGEIVGHRGAAGLAPENTLAAFEAALEAGVDRVELDVRLTADRHLVVFHDARLGRFAGASSSDRAVLRCPLAELRKLDVGAALGRPGCGVPTLDEALDLLAGRVRLNPEVKGSGAEGRATARALAEVLERRGLVSECLASSFHEAALAELRSRAPDLARAHVVDRRTSGDLLTTALRQRAVALHASSERVDAELLARCRREGLALRAFTVNEPDEMRRLLELGVDGIVTDRPDVLRRVAGR